MQEAQYRVDTGRSATAMQMGDLVCPDERNDGTECGSERSPSFSSGVDSILIVNRESIVYSIVCEERNYKTGIPMIEQHKNHGC